MASGVVLRRLLQARELLHAEAARGPTLTELAGAVGLSRAHLARQFARTFGVPPHQYLLRLRLALAKEALAIGTSVTEACLAAGFESVGTFSTTFRRRTGLSPRQWQRLTRPMVQSRGVPVIYVPSCFLGLWNAA